jgi:hypothetical protein
VRSIPDQNASYETHTYYAQHPEGALLGPARRINRFVNAKSPLERASIHRKTQPTKNPCYLRGALGLKNPNTHAICMVSLIFERIVLLIIESRSADARKSVN